MPEGPEIRREADRLAKVLVDERLEDVSFGLPRLVQYESRLAGCTVSAIDTRGKALLTRFDNGLTLYSHNQLYGRWYVCQRDGYPDTGRSLRVALHTATHSALLYSASDIEVLDEDELAQQPFLRRAGPDLLSEDLSAKAVAERLRGSRFRRRALQALYLDQSFIAGVGNYLRSEILFHARVAPGASPQKLDDTAIARLGRSTMIIGRRAYRTAGITNPPSRVRALKAQGYKRADYRFAVFAREDRPCYRCGSLIRRTTASSRRLYWCPVCQAP
ncbi:endonuclease VIII [Pistricoccus aurantiacus]|uniref:DNA-(apurinic or apyrimidinic site) lyase n=1 Tax=Pistricoccus aurantiacus TaxID=1883414 RepID=A0A5B8SSW6_9GAMM|nr:endonuclease VIII [Pistricoccus aurantiacus]QEA38183.1 endonuclease VIII [Pistricoccus aurantiacus]